MNSGRQWMIMTMPYFVDLFASMMVVTMQSCKDNWQYGSHQNSAQLHQGQALSVAYDLRQYVYARCIQEGACGYASLHYSHWLALLSLHCSIAEDQYETYKAVLSIEQQGQPYWCRMQASDIGSSH